MNGANLLRHHRDGVRAPWGHTPGGQFSASKCSDFQAQSTFTQQGRLEGAVAFSQLWAVNINEP